MSWLATSLKTLGVAAPIAAGAMLLPALILPVAGKAQPVLVLFSDGPHASELPERVSILGWQGHWARLENVDAKTARTLYGNGALFVMPFRKSGCMSYRKT